MVLTSSMALRAALVRDRLVVHPATRSSGDAVVLFSDAFLNDPLPDAKTLIVRDSPKVDPKELSRCEFKVVGAKHDVPGNPFEDYRVDGKCFPESHIDAARALALYVGEEPLAVYCAAIRDAETLMVAQWQGVTPWKIEKMQWGNPRMIHSFNWRKVGLQGLCEIAVQQGFTRAAVQNGHNNHWAGSRQATEKGLTLSDFVRMYDKPAEDMGFTQGTDRNWYMPISQALKL